MRTLTAPIPLLCVAAATVMIVAPTPAPVSTLGAMPGQAPAATPAQTAGSPAAVIFPSGVNDVALPVQFVDEHIVVRVEIDGRGLDFLLDSGAPVTEIDDTVARQLGLPIGPFSFPAGDPLRAPGADGTIIPAMRIGGLTLHDVPAALSRFRPQFGPSTRIVGGIGYDLLSAVVAKIDYVHDTVDAIAPSSFQPPRDGVIQVPLDLGDRLPLASATIGDDESDRFIVDTGSFGITLFRRFLSAHPADFPTPAPGVTVNDLGVIPIIGLGRGAFVTTMYVPIVRFGTVDFKNFDVFRYVGDDPGQPPDIDGLIGSRVLRYFDLYFDYPDAVLLLVQNRNASP
jgi:hypothetical protein